MAPLVADGRVYVGNSGGELGVRGWIAALDENTGKLLWKAFNTGPGQGRADRRRIQAALSVAIEAHDLGVKSWPPEAWKIGGGNVWGWVTYDAELHALYYGTGNPGSVERPAATRRQQVDGRHFRARSRERRGALVLPDTLRTMSTTTTASTSRSCSTCPSAAGCARCSSIWIATATSTSSIARTAQVLSADPYGPVNSSKGVDLKTGRLIVNPEKQTKVGRDGAQHLSHRLRRQGLAAEQLQSADRACSTSRTRTCAWIG